MENIILEIREALKSNANEETLRSSQRFFKDTVRQYGVKVPLVRKISKEYFKKIKAHSTSDVFKCCEILWQSGYMEEAFVACHWSYEVYKKYEPDDFILFKKWIDKYVDNWATCDTFCNHTVGTFITAYPEYIKDLKTFTQSDNRWMKRAAAVSLIIPARKGLFLDDVFEIADSLLADLDDLVQKGVGWMLKAASESNQKEVFEYVVKNKQTMPRTTLRYAIEKMPSEMKSVVMQRS